MKQYPSFKFAIKAFFRLFFRLVYGVQVSGQENLTGVQDRGAVFIVNHTSLIDGALLASFLPGVATFAVDTNIANAWWAKPFLKLIDYETIDPSRPMALKTLIDAAHNGKRVVVFPEGRITTTGALMKIYEGPGLIAYKANAPIVPVRISGAQYSSFSYLRHKLKRQWFPRIRITILPPVHLTIADGMTARQRRVVIADKLYDIMSDMIFETSVTERTLFDALLCARKRNGGGTKILEDRDRKPISYNRLVTIIQILGAKFRTFTEAHETIGVLLPNSIALTGVFFGLQANARVPAMLNFTSGLSNIRSACTAGQIKTILSSRKFVELAKLAPLINGLSETLKIVYLEDVAGTISAWNKLVGFVSSRLPFLVHRRASPKPVDTAVVLFTSGSEGVPKGVALSHKNILLNCSQLAARIDFNITDIVFNPLPLFHAFGLTAGHLLPLFYGVRTFLYTSPIHYRTVAALVYDCNATILFGTDTFLNGYARVANAYDFYSLRYVFAGAERVKDDTRTVYNDKFGLRILEGYGATETSPVLAINTPIHAQRGSVGRLLPGIRSKLEPVPGVSPGGRLFVKGPNIMRGYLSHDKPGELQPPHDGWYDTGDIVDIDERTFIKIVGRAKRFAKIAGEMVSLSAVESYIQEIAKDRALAVVGVPDTRKGEQLILFIDADIFNRTKIIEQAKAHHLPEIMIPRQIIKLDKLPLLGNGKIDYMALEAMALKNEQAA